MHPITTHGLLTCLGVTAFIIIFTILLNFIFNGFRKLVMKFSFGYKLICYLTAPGVAHHELSHALWGFILGAKIKKIVFFQKRDEDGTLGYVTYCTRGPELLQNFQSIFSGIGPIICTFFNTYFMLRFLQPVVHNSHNIIFILLFYYLLICILLHGTLSSADIHNVFSGLNVKTVLIIIFGTLFVVFIAYLFRWALLKPVYFFYLLGKRGINNLLDVLIFWK